MSRTMILAAAASLAASICVADEPPAVVKKYLAAVDAQRAVEISVLQRLVRDFQKGRQPIQVRGCQARIRGLQAKSEFPTPLLNPFNLSIGDIGMPGKLSGGIIGGNQKQLAKAELEVVEVATYTVAQVLPNGLLVSIDSDDHDSQLIIIEGVRTSGVVDGKKLGMSEVFEVTGTKTYTTVLGASKTVFVLKTIDMKLVNEHIKNSIKP
jgi:hypothetical protein